MRLLHFLEIENFKRWGDKQRIKPNHPAVKADHLANKTDLRNRLKHFSDEHSVKARGRGYTPKDHVNRLRNWIPNLKGLAIPDHDGRDRRSAEGGALAICHWNRYEAENDLGTPDILGRYAQEHYQDMERLGGCRDEIDTVPDRLILEQALHGGHEDFQIWQQNPDAARLVCESKTERLKLSTFAEEFFRHLSAKVGGQMLLKKGELHRLAALIDPKRIPAKVAENPALLEILFKSTNSTAS